MLPPTIKNSPGKPSDTNMDLLTKYSSVGNIPLNRASVRRRLFADENPENSPQHCTMKSKLEELYSAEKERALRVWGFDLSTESPSTSSDFEWSATSATDVPSFYTRSYGTNRATFSPKFKDRLNNKSLTNIIPRDSSWKSAWMQTKSESSAGQVTAAAASSSSGTTETAGRKSANLDVTPARNRGKTNANKPSISRQVRLTEFYAQRKRPASDSSPTNKRKRSATGPNQGESSPDPLRS